MITVEFVKRTRYRTFWILPGTRMEFANAGQAGYFTATGAAKIVNKRGRPAKRKAAADRDANGGTDAAGGEPSGSQTKPEA